MRLWVPGRSPKDTPHYAGNPSGWSLPHADLGTEGRGGTPGTQEGREGVWSMPRRTPRGHGGVAWGGVLCSSQKGLQLGGVHTQLPLAACLSDL